MHKWTSEEIAILQRDYPTVPTITLARALGRSRRAVWMKAQKLGLRKIGKPGYRVPESRYRYERRKYPLLPLTKATAYAVGFILADGWVGEDRIKLSNKNPLILAKVRNALGFSHSLKLERKGPHDIFTVTITNKVLAGELRALGIPHDKSWTARLPEIPDELFNHFLRGYFDGDGTARYSRRGGLQLRFVSGSRLLLIDLAEHLHRILGIPVGLVQHDRDRPTANRLYYNGPTAAAIGEYMYRDAGDLFIPRKRLPFTDYASRQTSRKLTRQDAEEIRRLAASGEPAARIAKRFSVSDSLVRLIIAGKRWAE